MTRVIGYLRSEINEQNNQSQLDRLRAAGVGTIYQEKPSATPGDTAQLDKLMAEAGEGDTLVVTCLHQIARNTRHLLAILQSLHAAGVTCKVLESGIDTATSQGDIMRMLLAAIVDFERQIAKDRQAAGIARARREGRYKGRKPTAMAKSDEVLALDARGLTRQKIAAQLGIGVASVYRILKTRAKPKATRKQIASPPGQAAVKKEKEAVRKPTRETDTEQLSFF